MGGGSLGFAGSIASFCMALLKAYCEDNQKNNYRNHVSNDRQVVNLKIAK